MLCLITFSFMPKSALMDTGSQGIPKLFLGCSGEVRTLVVRTACFQYPPQPSGLSDDSSAVGEDKCVPPNLEVGLMTFMRHTGEPHVQCENFLFVCFQTVAFLGALLVFLKSGWRERQFAHTNFSGERSRG